MIYSKEDVKDWPIGEKCTKSQCMFQGKALALARPGSHLCWWGDDLLFDVDELRLFFGQPPRSSVKRQPDKQILLGIIDNVGDEPFMDLLLAAVASKDNYENLKSVAGNWLYSALTQSSEDAEPSLKRLRIEKQLWLEAWQKRKEAIIEKHFDRAFKLQITFQSIALRDSASKPIKKGMVLMKKGKRFEVLEVGIGSAWQFTCHMRAIAQLFPLDYSGRAAKEMYISEGESKGFTIAD